MRVDITGRRVCAEPFGFFEVSATYQATLQLLRNLVIITSLVGILVSFYPLHGADFNSFLDEFLEFIFAKNDSCVELLPLLPLFDSRLAKSSLDVCTARCEVQILVAILLLRWFPGGSLFLLWSS